MIAEAQDKYKYEHAWLNAVIFNSQGPKEENTPWQIEDFISDNDKELTEEEIILAQQKELEKWHNWLNNCRKG